MKTTRWARVIATGQSAADLRTERVMFLRAWRGIERVREAPHLLFSRVVMFITSKPPRTCLTVARHDSGVILIACKTCCNRYLTTRSPPYVIDDNEKNEITPVGAVKTINTYSTRRGHAAQWSLWFETPILSTRKKLTSKDIHTIYWLYCAQ